jgi:ELWxxDGT repeat protein
LYFSATDGMNGTELWKSDGTSAGTVLVKDINPSFNSSSPRYLTNVNGTIYFHATNGTNGYELWKSDGTSSGTVLVKDIWPGALSGSPRDLTNFNGTLYFRVNDGATGYELWKSDGTSTGTVLVKDIWPGASGSPLSFANVNGTLYFQATDGTIGGAKGSELWKTDGTSSGTVLVKDINPGTASSSPLYLTNINGTLYFRASDGTTGFELWKSDGTSSGTVLVKDIQPGFNNSGVTARAFANVSGTLYFTASDGTNGFELWTSNDTSAGTVLVKDIQPGAINGFPQDLTNINGTLYFRAKDGINGYELWKSDGTSSGTVLVKDLYAGSVGSVPRSFTFWNNQLYFVAYDPGRSDEIWVSDGTSAGTQIVSNVSDGTDLGPISSLVAVNNTLLFSAFDTARGQELWKLSEVTAGNSRPINTVPGPRTVNEDTALAISGISISDVDAGTANVSVTLSVATGTLTVSTNTGGGVTGGDISGNGGASVTIIASQAAINTTLASASGLVYQTPLNFNGSDALTIATNDLGNTGEPGALTDTDTVAITVNAVNDGPANTVPGAQVVDEDATLAISGISISDVDAGTANISVTLSVASGTLNVSTIAASGVTSGAISGNGGATVTITGSPAAINATLASASGLVYQGTLNFNGNDVLTVLTNDLGNTGTSGALTDSDTITITVNAVNDAPTNTVPALITATEDVAQAITGLSISDVDAGALAISVTLSVSNGTLNVLTNAGGGVTGGAISGNGGASVTITAPRAAINATLASASGLMYLGATNFNGSDVLTVTTNDLGNTGESGALTDTDTMAITVNEVNDVPTGTNDSLSAIAEDSGNWTISFASLLGNDSTVPPANESGQTLTITNVGSAVGGSVSIVGSDVIFSPTLNFNGAASFVYTLRDNGTTAGVNDFKTATATASFTITEVNDAPNAVTNVVPFFIGPGTRTISQASLLANDTPGPANESSQTLTFGTVSSPLPSGATAVVSGSDVLYTPPLGYSGPASFTYTVTDNGTTNSAPDPLTSTGTASLFFLFPGVALPAIDLNGPLANFSNTVTYTENNPPVVIPTATATLTDTDSTYLLSVTATLLAAPDGASEVLSAVTTGTSITANYNPTTRVLTLMGPDSAVNFQQVLRTVAYQNMSEAPTTTARTVRFVTSDGGNLSSARDATVNIVAVSDAPSVAGTTTALSYTENAGPTVMFPDLTANDPDSFYFLNGSYQAGLTRATISISPYIAGQDVLSYTNAGIPGSFNTTTGVFTLNGSATLSQYNNALRLITYRNTSDDPNTTPRVLTVTVFDSTAPSATLSRTLNITSVNDAPTADLNGPVGAGNDYTTTYRTSVGTIPIAYSTSTVTDLDNATMTSLTVTITNVQNASNEVLTYTLPGGISASAPSNTSSTVVFSGVTSPATYQTLLRSIQYRNLAGSPTLGTPRTITVVTNDGTSTLTSTTTVTLVSPLQAASDPAKVVADKITTTELQPIVQAAIGRWSALGLTPAQVAHLQSTTYVVANIGLARELGQASSGKVVTIDDNAAGFGWFVDTTPRDDQEFTKAISKSERVAPGMTRMDLLTVVMHEMGHILGLPDIDDDKSTGVMTDAIAAGTRRVSTAADLQALAFYLSQNGTASTAPIRNTDVARADVFARWS